MEATNKKVKGKLKKLSDDEAEALAEWIVEARAEGYSWKAIAKNEGVTVKTIKSIVGAK